MLGDKDATVTIPVKDLERAKQFYEKTVGLKPTPSEESGALTYHSGSASVLVYQSEYAGTNKATAATWVVGDEIDELVKDLRTKGVTFEHYDLPGLTHKGDLHVANGFKAAWFKDPDGNILALVNG